MAIYVTRPYLAEEKEYQDLLHGIWQSGRLTNGGPLHGQLQEALREFLKTERIGLTVNGHLALEALLSSLQAPPGSEVITTPFTFASTTHAIVRSGLVPVFCDVTPENLTMDPGKIEELISDKTVAILPVHVYGFPCRVEEINAVARRHGLKVFYDAAHAFGVQYRGRSLCDYGDGAILSFHATKLFHTIEGGAVISHNSEMAECIERSKNYGILDEETVVFPGGNAKMNEFQAAVGIVNLKHIREIIGERKRLTELYRSYLWEIPGIRFFAPENEETVYNYAYLPILIRETEYGMSRDAVYERLKREGIFCRKYFYPLTGNFQCYQGKYPCHTPVAQRAS